MGWGCLCELGGMRELWPVLDRVGWREEGLECTKMVCLGLTGVCGCSCLLEVQPATPGIHPGSLPPGKEQGPGTAGGFALLHTLNWSCKGPHESGAQALPRIFSLAQPSIQEECKFYWVSAWLSVFHWLLHSCVLYFRQLLSIKLSEELLVSH